MAIVLIQIGAANPDEAKSGTSQKPERNNSVLGPQGAVSDSIVKFFSSKKTVKDQIPEKGTVSSTSKVSPGAKVVNVSAVSTTHTIAKTNKIGKRVVPPPPVSRLAVPQIRQEIQKILDLNKKIKMIQGGRTGQFQRVQEQARIHQKILNQLEASPGSEAKLTSKTPSKEALLAQEKLRIIHEETQRNAALLEAVSSANPATVSGQGPAGSGGVLKFKKTNATVEPVPESERKSQNS